MEVVIGSDTYRTGRIDARKQFHLSRKLLPLVMSLGKGLAGNREVQSLLDESGLDSAAVASKVSAGAPVEKKDALTIIDVIMSALAPASGVIAQMSEEDMDYVINTCLRVCERKVGNGWAPCMAVGSTKLMFDDMEMLVLIRLATAVVVENIGSFFLESQSKSP